jgi:ribosome-binding factor A
MTRDSFHGTFNHRQLRVGELIKQNLGQIFLKNEAKIPSLNTKLVTITEVKMSSDLKSARAYVIPLGGKEIEKTVNTLTEFSYLVRKALSKKLDIKFLPKRGFVGDESLNMQSELRN